MGIKMVLLRGSVVRTLCNPSELRKGARGVRTCVFGRCMEGLTAWIGKSTMDGLMWYSEASLLKSLTLRRRGEGT